MWRKIFSITTTELSISRENASARPLRTMLLIVSFAECRTKNVTITESGIERNTAAVARVLPKKIRIMIAVRNRPMPPSRKHSGNRLLHNKRLVEDHMGLQLRRECREGS